MTKIMIPLLLKNNFLNHNKMLTLFCMTYICWSNQHTLNYEINNWLRLKRRYKYLLPRHCRFTILLPWCLVFLPSLFPIPLPSSQTQPTQLLLRVIPGISRLLTTTPRLRTLCMTFLKVTWSFKGHWIIRLIVRLCVVTISVIKSVTSVTRRIRQNVKYW